MPLDTSIPLQVQAPQIQDPLTAYSKILGVQQEMNQSRLANLQIKNLETEMGQKQKLRDLFSSGLPQTPTGETDWGQVGSKMAGITGDPTAAVKLQTGAIDLKLKQAQAQGANLDVMGKAYEQAGRALGTVKDQDSYVGALQSLASSGDPTLSALATHIYQQHPQYDPANVQNLQTMALGVKDRIDLQMKGQAQQETARHNRADEATAGGNLAVAQTKLDPNFIEKEAAAKARGEMEAFGPVGGAPGAPGAAGAPAGPTGDEFLKTLDPNMASQVKALAEGRMQIPSGFALKSPYWQNMIRALGQYDPNFDMVNYNARANTRKDFTSGKSADNVTALNTAVAHLGSLSEAYDALKNGDYPAYNKAANYLGQQFGNPELQKQFADVSTRSEAVAHELAKVFRNSGMSEAEVNAWKQRVDPNAPPGSQRGVIGSALDLMRGRLMALSDRYNTGMGTTKDPMDLLTPEAKATFAKLEQYANAAPGGVPTRPGANPRGASGSFDIPPTNAQGWQLHQDAHGNFAYVSPDGKQVQEVK